MVKLIEEVPVHIASLALAENNPSYAHCNCGWLTEPTDDVIALRRIAVEHSDPEALEQMIYLEQVAYPHLTREQILYPEEYPLD